MPESTSGSKLEVARSHSVLKPLYCTLFILNKYFLSTWIVLATELLLRESWIPSFHAFITLQAAVGLNFK
jgi:hypothetical protein